MGYGSSAVKKGKGKEDVNKSMQTIKYMCLVFPLSPSLLSTWVPFYTFCVLPSKRFSCVSMFLKFDKLFYF